MYNTVWCHRAAVQPAVQFDRDISYIAHMLFTCTPFARLFALTFFWTCALLLTRSLFLPLKWISCNAMQFRLKHDICAPSRKLFIFLSSFHRVNCRFSRFFFVVASQYWIAISVQIRIESKSKQRKCGSNEIWNWAAAESAIPIINWIVSLSARCCDEIYLQLAVFFLSHISIVAVCVSFFSAR